MGVLKGQEFHKFTISLSLSLQLVGKLEEKCSLLPANYKKALSADPDKIMHTTLGDVGIFYDANGKQYYSVNPLEFLMDCFIKNSNGFIVGIVGI